MHKKLRNNMKKALQEIFPVELKQYRLKQGLTQEVMAKWLMVSTRSYADLEHGVTIPSATTLALYLTLLSKGDLKRLLDLLREKAGNAL